MLNVVGLACGSSQNFRLNADFNFISWQIWLAANDILDKVDFDGRVGVVDGDV